MSDRELIVVRDHRASTRAFGPVPPVEPNDNGPDGTVAPQAASGEVMGVEARVYGETEPVSPSPPPDAQRWAGWPGGWATQPWLGGGEQLTSRVSTVFACVRLNSGAIGSMTPVVTVERRQAPVERLPLWLRSPQPELYSDIGEALEQIDVSLEYTGDAYLYATSRDGGGRPRTWMVLDPTICTAKLEGGVRRVYVKGADLTDDVLHLRYRSSPGRADGLSPLEGARGNLISAAALETYGAKLASMGGIPWGVLEMPTRLRSTQAKQVADDFVESRQRLDGAPAVVSGGANLKTLTLSPKDMALLDLRVFDEQRIAAAFGVAPYLVGLPQPSGLTYANATGLREDHYRSTLRPTAAKIARGLSTWALPSDLTMTLNASEYVQGTVAERVETYIQLLTAIDPATNTGVISGEELRALVGLPPREDTGTAISALTTGTQ